MPRVKVDWFAASKDNYKDFCKNYPGIKLSSDEWKSIIYGFNESFRDYILETGENAKFPHGFGEFSISKKKIDKFIEIDGKEYINLPIDWKKSREKHKTIYLLNHHTEGFLFGWHWFKSTSRLKHTDLWYFKASRVTARILAHYLKISDKYQHLYKERDTSKN